MTGEDELLTTREVAKALRITSRTVVNYCLAGEFAGAFKLSGAPNSPWRIPRSAFDAYMEKQRGRPLGDGRPR